jgi:hypothetical protein
MSKKKTAIVTRELQSGLHAVIEVRRDEIAPDDHRGRSSLRQDLRDRVGLGETRRLAFATLQNAVIAGVLLFYSRSVLEAVVRACVGA